MPRRRLVRAVLPVLLWGGFLSAVGGCSRTDEADRIREWIREVAARAERHDIAGILAATTEDFRADPGHRDREGVREVLAVAFLRYRRFRILHPRPSVELARDERSAVTAVPFLVVRAERTYPGLEELYRDPGGWLAQVGKNADLYQLELHLVRSGDGWLADAARLEAIGRSGVAQ